jgi:hypothetical protein
MNLKNIVILHPGSQLDTHFRIGGGLVHVGLLIQTEMKLQ